MDAFEHGVWILEFDERQRSEIDLATVYAGAFAHGTTGHNQLMIIAKLTAILDFIYGKGQGAVASDDDFRALLKRFEERAKNANRNP